jgi:DNA polymerase-3 subunit gamma/tau
MDELHRDGAEPIQLLGDLAEAVHAAARVKAVGGDVGSEGLSAEERRRVGTIAGKLSTPLLSRAWQMLLKGGEEAVKAANPRAAAEMVLIRLAYTADLPAPDEVIRLLGGEGALARSGKPAPADGGTTRDAPLNQAAPAQPENVSPVQPTRAPPAPVATTFAAEDTPPADDEDPGFDADYAASLGELASDDDAPAPGMLADPRSFDEVIALAGERRDMMLKLQLEDRVSLVKFDYTAGSIDLFLLPGAPPQLANELREKLNAWSQRKWVVVLSKAAGDRPRGEVRREREAAELEVLKAHPVVKAVLEQFPDAKIAEIRGLIGVPRDETGTG